MLRDSRGVSIVELVVAMVIMTVTVAAGVQSFRFITTAIRQSRSKTIAINLAQEKMEVLKNLSYFQLQVTTNSFSPSDYPNVAFDKVNYTSETITLWGLPPFTRGVYVAYADNFGAPPVVSTIPPTSIDTGLKEAFVYVLYQDSNLNKQVSVSNLYANPNASALDATISGTVCISPGTGASCALGSALNTAFVSVLGNPNWSAYTDASGNYSFQVANGTYTVTVSSTGYFSQNATNIVAYRNAAVTQNFSMVKMDSGTVFTTAWFSPQLVISQVVASSGTQGGVPVQYVELYNPTTFTWNANANDLELIYCKRSADCPTASGATFPTLTFHRTTIPSHSYYLIASTSPINAAGVQKDADAEWSGLTMGIGSDGGLSVDATFTSYPFDMVAWHNTSGADAAPTILTEGTAVNMAGGLADNQQLVRQTSTGTVSVNLGNAYDTDKNSANFIFFSSAIVVHPHNHTDVLNLISGRPAHSALIRANDTLQASTQAVAFNVGTSTEYAGVSLINVATGVWNVDIASNTVGNWNFGSYFNRTTGVQMYSTMIAAGISTGIANGMTSPTSLTNMPTTIMTSTSSDGWVQGYVYGSGSAYNTPLANILVAANGTQGYTNSNGYYFLNVSTGIFSVTANFNSHDPTYTSQDQGGSVGFAQIVRVPDFHLAQEGFIKGYVTSGTGALPNVTVKAAFGTTSFSALSDYTGYFYINVSTSGTAYTLSPVLDPSQSYTTSPDPLSVTVTVPGATVFGGTITVTGAMGYISGSVKTAAGANITTGVLIIASGGTIADPPTSVYASSAPAYSNPIYAGSSQADGTYSLAVRAGSYNMSAYYPIVDPFTGNVTYTRKTTTVTGVTGGNTTGGQNFTW